MMKHNAFQLLLGVLLLTLNCRSYSQSTNWDSILTGSQWYVPPQNTLAYLTSTSNFTQTVQVGDQTLWSIISCVNGFFAGTSSQSLTVPISGGVNQTASNTGMNGFINNAGQVLIDFTTTNGGPPTIALGNYRNVVGGTTNLIEMQMISQIASDQYITHWAYMASYTNANYPTTTPSNSAFLSTNWQWMQGTTWNITDNNLFGTNGGSFTISTYNSGYFWGNGTGTTNGGFTLIGSATPEGNLILGFLNNTNGLETSLFGSISGNASNASMSLSTFTTNGITPGPPVATAEVVPGPTPILYVTNGAALYLTNGINIYANTYVGNAANDSNNLLTIANTNTQLTNSQNLYVGNLGSRNTMVITNGAMVADSSGFIGYDSYSSNNSVLVTGSNSVWSNSADLYVGYSGSSNSLIITNGAKVLGANTYISSFGGSTNSVQISGTGSTLSNSGSIWVGASPVNGVAGTGTLTITSGGILAAANLIISGATNSVGTVEFGLKGGSNSNMTLNVPLITFGEGTGSLGLNQSDTLTISGTIQGATATNSYAMIQQYGSGTTILTGISHTGLGYRVDGGQLMVNGGILDIYLSAGISPDELGGPRTVTVGNKYSGISLVVTNGGELHSFVTIIGTDLIKNSDTLTTSSNNWAVITGPGSKLIAGEFQIGNVSSGNSLVISNGATASSALSTSIGISGSSNSVTVTGAGSLFTNAGSLTVGTYSQSYVAAANRLLITNGAGLVSDSAMIGATTNSFGNIVTVTGAGSFWTNSGALYVGMDGSGNSLAVANGATVAMGGGTNGTVVGFSADSSNNSVLVTGSNSSLRITKALFVGYGGGGNTLTISNGASVTVACTGNGDYLSLGENGGSSNTLTVTGASTLTVNAGALSLYGIWIGDSDRSSNNRMVVSDGGRVYSTGESGIGCVKQSGDTEALITGAGSLWTNNGVLAIGARDGGNGVVTVANGGTLAATEIKIANLTNTSTGTLNIGSLGGSDTAGTIISPTIAFGAGTGTINFNQIDATKVAANISDSGNGAINQNGLGTTTLNGNNSGFSGLTTISGGTLQIGDGATKGGAVSAGNFVNNSTLNFVPSSSDTYTVAGNISGNGSLNQLGTGTTILNGNNSGFSGLTTITRGTLVAASTNALGSSDVTLGGTANTATLRLATNLTVTTSGPSHYDLNWGINGVIALAQGTHTLTLGGMTNSAGNNDGGNVFQFLNATLSNATNVLINYGSLADFTTKSFSVQGISGYSFSTNGNQVSAYLSTNANVVVSNSVTINNTLTLRSFTVAGGSTTVVSSEGVLNSTGDFMVSGNSTLDDNGLIVTPSLTVDQGSTLMGSGTLSLIGGNLNLNGTIAPGNSPGTFFVSGGNLVMGSTAIWDQQIYSTSLYDRVVVTGAAFLNGTMNITSYGSGGLEYGQKYNFLTASGGISGAFTSITAPEGFRGRLLLSSNNTEANILIAPSSYTLLAQGKNQIQVATALDSFIPATSGDRLVISTSLDSLTASQYNQAFNAIMPTMYQSMATIALNQANALNMQLNQHLWGLRLAEGGGFSMSGFADNTPILEGQGDGAGDGKGVLDSKQDILRPGMDNHWGMFVDANGIFAQANSGNMLPGYNAQSGGVTAGLTYKWNENFASGLYCGYQGTYSKMGANGSGLETGSSLIDNAVRFGVFGTYGHKDGKGLYANALAGGAYHNYQATRVIQYTGMNRTANSAPGAGELDTMLATGYDIQNGKFTFGPTASLQYTYLGVSGVNETGAQSLNFNSGGWNSSSMLSSVGAHAAYNWQAGMNVVVVPQISLNWQHEFMQNPYAISGNLGGTSPTFSNTSATGIRDYLYTGVGFTVEFAKKWNTSFFYNAAAGNSDLVSQNIFWSAGVKF